MISKKSAISFAAAVMAGCGWASAQAPVINIVNDNGSASLETLSDNGEWAVGYGKSPLSEIGYSYPKLYNVKTHESRNLYKDGEEMKIAEMMALDVTDDGSLIVGQYDSKPAIWSASTGEWEFLPVNVKGYPFGMGTNITPDGKIAIGKVISEDGWNETIVLWDLSGENPADITPNNLPKPVGMAGEESYKQLRPCDLSADGTKFIGMVAFSFPPNVWSFVYDLTTGTWEGIGVDVKENGDDYLFSNTGEGYAFIEGGEFRPGSNEIVGCAYLLDDTQGIYTYNIDTKETSIVDDSAGKLFGAVDRYGLIYASTPSGSQLRNWSVKAGKYWYDFKVLCRQMWGIDWDVDITGTEGSLSGTIITTSNDGDVLIANEYTNTPYDSFVIELNEPMAEICPKVNILDNYFVMPVNNSAFSILKQVQVMFDRNIEVVGEPFDAVLLKNSKGEEVGHSVNVAVDASDPRLLSVTFRNIRLDVGEQYSVTIPEGVVSVAGDLEKLNPEITVNYKGRPQAPVAVVNVSPEDGIAIERINASSNPVTFTFDAEISRVEEGGNIKLYLLNEDGEREEIALLSGSITGNALSVYPVMEQRLAKGSNYEIVIEANSVADISGSDPNKEFVVHYKGNWIPGGDPRKPFEDDFSNGITLDKWMLYDGDQLEPAEEPAGWGFYKELPWWIVRDGNESTDFAAAAHSMYNPVGQADDWMVTNQIYIADETAMLSFKSQSYRRGANDVLKVYVYATDDVYTALTETIIDRFRYKGTLIYDEVQDPGASEELMAGDWRQNVIKLDEFAGKNIYIAFVNDNRNKSAVFIDDVVVSRDVKYTLANLTPTSVLAAEEVTVKGILTVESQTDTYKGYTLTLSDAEGNVISTVADENKELAGGDEVEFTFPETLKTQVGKVTRYTINVKLGDLDENLDGNVRNLAIATTRKVVIEEYTGQGCPNCPLGHAALEHIEKDFGDQVIPLAIHTYPGDRFGTPQAVQLQEFLGLSAAPTGRINRGPVASPMAIEKEKYYYKDNGLWYDYVVAALGEYADADINITSAVFDGEKYKVNVETVYALDMDNRNVNIFTVITEDELQGVQDNNRAGEEDEALGEWGKGGIYGQSQVPYVYKDVVRTWAGTTCNGYGGYIPATVVGGQVYEAEILVPTIKRINDPKNTKVTVMLIDASTGLVINANRAEVVVDTDSVEGIGADGAATAYVENGNVVVKSNGLALVDVYSVDGVRLASEAGEGTFTVDVNGYEGMALVTVKSAENVKTFKVFVK